MSGWANGEGTIVEVLAELESLASTRCHTQAGPPTRYDGHTGDFTTCEAASCQRRRALLTQWGRTPRPEPPQEGG